MSHYGGGGGGGGGHYGGNGNGNGNSRDSRDSNRGGGGGHYDGDEDRRRSRDDDRRGSGYAGDNRYSGSSQYGGHGGDRRGYDDRGRNDDRDRNDDRGRNDDRSRDDDRRGSGSAGYSGSSQYGGRGDDRGGGGGGGGGGRGSSFQGRGGGGRGGKPVPMGGLSHITDAMSAVTSNQILAVINPPSADRVANSVPGGREATYSISDGAASSQSWRYTEPAIGATIQVVANNFIVPKEAIMKALGDRRVYQFHLDIRKTGRDDVSILTKIDDKRDARVRSAVFSALLRAHAAEWADIGITFDGQTIVFATKPLVNNQHPSYAHDTDSLEEEVILQGQTRPYFVSLKMTTVLDLDPENFSHLTLDMLRALDSVLINFAKAQMNTDAITWIVDKSNAFRANGIEIRAAALGYIFRKGYKASLKSCIAGLVLTVDMAVTCFLKGGELVDLMAVLLKFRTTKEFVDSLRSNSLNRADEFTLKDHFRGAQIRLSHNANMYKKLMDFGPPASDRYHFENENGSEQWTSVQDYTERKYNIKLKYPWLPTVDIGRKNKPVLIPSELVLVTPGQVRHGKVNKDKLMLAQLIKESAVRPSERFAHILGTGDGGNDFISCVKNDHASRLFGLSGLVSDPMSVGATILPNAILKYGSNVNFDPKLTGSWNMAGKMFVRPALPSSFLIMVCSDSGNCDDRAIGALEREFSSAANRLSMVFKPLRAFNLRRDVAKNNKDIETIIDSAQGEGADILIVVLDKPPKDDYGFVKLCADKLGLPTQCLKYQNIFDRKPNQYETSVLLKINTKLGGINHALIGREDTKRSISDKAYNPNNSSEVFQDPPSSLSWVFDTPTMMMGIDVSHPDGHGDAPSIAAVVASMDRYCMQYACKISIQTTARSEVVTILEEATKSLMQTFKERNNGVLPERIIIYRDGVSDGQFIDILVNEFPAVVRGAASHFNEDDSRVKICVLVCQKSHNNRFVYQNNSEYINVCPGTCVDRRNGQIVSAAHNDFYLTSHTAIQGTSKSTRYVVLYDSIGLKMNEIELLTYWSTYLYCRCNKSIGLATPAKYAHWAAKRGNYLQQQGACDEDFEGICNTFNTATKRSCFFFI